MDEVTVDNIAMGFRDLSVSSHDGCKPIIHKVNGYVARGCMTAVMGPSASGKSVLLQTLSGRLQDVHISGDVYMKMRQVNVKSTENPVAYVPQDDSLQGELTAREVTYNTAVLKRNEPKERLDADVAELLEQLGLSHVADGMIGTVLFRGLSGGQKKRAEVSCELIASPTVLLLDEPTSGLDSSISYEVLHTIRDLVKKSNGSLSVLFTIHQPNSRILELFDHLMLMEGGTTTYFGPAATASEYFAGIGYPCPAGVTPTDYFLQLSDPNFSSVSDFDFTEAFEKSPQAAAVTDLLDRHAKRVSAIAEGKEQAPLEKQKSSATVNGRVPFLRQVYTLIYREYALAYRDPTLYYFQVTLLLAFGFMCGAVFWDLPQDVNANFALFPNSVLWLVLCHSWIHAFKVYYLNSINKRTEHEIGNGKYDWLAWSIADTFSTSTLTTLFFGVPPIAYFMYGLPAKAFPFIILCCWVTSLCAEAMMAFICKLSKNATTSMIFCQIALVNLEVFGGGAFIPWKDCPDWWIWVQESNIFTHSSRAMIMEVMDHTLFHCKLTGGVCISRQSGYTFPCEGAITTHTNGAGDVWDSCKVNGRELLYEYQGVGVHDSYWKYFGFLILIGACFKAGVVFLNYMPFDRVVYKIMHGFGNQSSDAEFEAEVEKNYQAQRAQRKQRGTAVEKREGEYAAVGSDDPEVGPKSIENGKPVLTSAISKGKMFDAESNAALMWCDLNVILPHSNKKICDGVSGYVQRGRVLALMGPSGAGKTTLLNGLAKRAGYATVEGNISFAGRPMTSSDLTYVPQFDEINGALTVFEHFKLVGDLTCVDQGKMLERLELLLDVLGLVSKRDVQVENLSGGEMKRVSVGIGMISDPYVLFLDEPTTGLDSTAAYSIVQYLVSIAAKTNVAVIMTIHQPSALVFDMLDDLMLLEQGHLAYAGTIENAKAYFTSVGYPNTEQINPADYYLDIIQHEPEQEGATWKQLFLDSPSMQIHQQRMQELGSSQIRLEKAQSPATTSRFLTMLSHFMMYFVREKGIYVYRFGALIVIALFMGTLYLDLNTNTDNIPRYTGAMFGTAISVVLTAVSSTYIYAKNRREAVERIANGIYSPGTFVAAQFLACTFYNFLVSFGFVCIFHWLVDLCPDFECFAYDVLISWGHLMMMEGMIQIFVEVLKNDFLATTASMIFIGSNMLFAGFFRTVAQTPAAISWLCFVFPMRWSFAGFATQIFEGRNWDVSGYGSAVPDLKGKDILDNFFDLRNVNTWGMFGALLGYVFLFRFGQFFLMAAQTGVIKIPMPAFVYNLLHQEKPVEKAEGQAAAPKCYMAVSKEDSPAEPAEVSAGGSPAADGHVELTKVSPADKA